MKEQVATRKAEIQADKPLLNDAFSMLVKANQSEASKYQMDDQELVSFFCTAFSFAQTIFQYIRLEMFSFYYSLVTVRSFVPLSNRGSVFVLTDCSIETTAHTLAATLGFLGLYNDVQEEVLEQIISVIGHERDPVCTKT